jgi:hypothetical protein
MTAEEERALGLESARGERAKAVMSLAGWIKDIVPYLEQREVELSKGSSWRPGNSTDTGAVLLGCAYNGGRQDECKNLVNQLKIWEEQGTVAAVKLIKYRGKKQ